MQAHQLHSLPPSLFFFSLPPCCHPLSPFFLFLRTLVRSLCAACACVRAGAAGASSPQQACAPLTLHACVCVPFQGMFSACHVCHAVHSSLCIFFAFVFGVCCCSLVAAGTCKADKHPTQPGICIEHMLVEEEEEKREG